MRLLSDSIEDFIKALLEDETHTIELRRNELAEHFQVSEEFIRKAVCLYTHGNLAAELYF